MRRLRASSLEEYAAWYLNREDRKRDDVAPARAIDPVRCMWDRHSGKMRDWFGGRARWSIVLLDELPEFERLIFLESDWTKAERLVIPEGTLNYRLLRKVAGNALASSYLSRPTASKHRQYYDAIHSGELTLQGVDRITVCSAKEPER